MKTVIFLHYYWYLYINGSINEILHYMILYAHMEFFRRVLHLLSVYGHCSL